MLCTYFDLSRLTVLISKIIIAIATISPIAITTSITANVITATSLSSSSLSWESVDDAKPQAAI